MGAGKMSDGAERANRAKPVVEIENLCKVFRDFWFRPKVQAVSKFNCRIFPGEVFGLLGPNGSGKTTIIKMILGLLNPSCGRIMVLGASPRDVRSKSRIGYLPEESYLYPFLTAHETIAFYGRLFNIGNPELRRRGDELLRMVGLEHARRRPIEEFSKGMARRIGLAQALVNDPDLVILDEPTSGLDPAGCRQVKDLILTLARRGKSILISSHLLADVEDVCDRVAILCNGATIVQGSIRDLLEKKESYRLTFESATRELLEKTLDIIRRETGLRPRVDHPAKTLEEFFLEVVAGAQQESKPTGVAQAHQVADYLAGEEKEPCPDRELFQ